jgi:hypothetical protein
MTTLIEQLPGEIARLEAKYGPDNRFVKDLKEQLRASKETVGMSSEQVFKLQSFQFPSKATAPASPDTSQEENEESQQRWRETVGRNRALKEDPSKA